jgi:YVTN family beta-propeller protein
MSWGRGTNAKSLRNHILYPLETLGRCRRLLPVLVVVLVFCSGYSFPAPVQLKDVLSMHPSVRSEKAPWMQQADIIGTSPSPGKGTKGGEEPSNASGEHPSGDQQGTNEETANVYAATTSTKVSEQLANVPQRVYVPNVGDGTMDVIDPKTFKIIDHYPVGEIPHHVTPSWDMKSLYVDNEASSSLTIIDPNSGKPSGFIPIPYPYNLYFTPDGKKAIVVVERLQTLEFRDPHTWKLLGSVYIPSAGVDHMDFSSDGHYLLASSEWGGTVTKVDTQEMKITGEVQVGGNPVDVKLSPDGSLFYVANQGAEYGGVQVIDPKTMKVIKYIPTGRGAHGLYVSRDAKSLYVANRLSGTISVIDFASRKVVETWNVGGSPDMFQLSPDGTQLWYADRYNGTVSVVDTRTGELMRRIVVGYYPHGITYFPNVGRYSLGHNGVYR